MASTSEIAPIPLCCSLCPKQPKFSDISHLLTHIASKGHLSHEFRLSIRTSTDSNAKQQLDNYQQWYSHYGLEKLLSNRMAAKEFRNAKQNDCRKAIIKRNSAQLSTARHQAREVSAAPVSGSSDEANNFKYLQDLLDKHNRQSVGGEAEEMALQSSNGFSAQRPRLHLWPTAMDRLNDAPEPMAHSASPTSSVFSEFSTFISCSPDNQADRQSQGTVSSCAVSDIPVDQPNEMMGGMESAKGQAQLKGVFWPGMNIFDSATPDAKRKRNQRKDGSLLAQMELSSAQVTPTEIVFGADGSFQRQRRMSGLSDEEQPLRKNPTRGKRSKGPHPDALAEKNPNAPHVRYNVRKEPEHLIESKSQGRNTRSKSSMNGRRTHQHQRANTQPSYQKVSTNSRGGRYNQGNKRSKRNVAVFQDPQGSGDEYKDDEIEQRLQSYSSASFNYNHPFGNQRSLDLINSDFAQPQFEKQPISSLSGPYYHRQTAPTAIMSNSKGFVPRPDGKENIDPNIDGRERALLDEPRTYSEQGYQRQTYPDDPFVSSFNRGLRYGPELSDFSNGNNSNYLESPMAGSFSGGEFSQFPYGFDYWNDHDFSSHLRDN
ncbi:MAG: Mismatch repair protein msh3 [Chaenotheca gracillima]|nr:MAG: Mismatch repair protein msh3 [Chaenotheca gracillima]